MFAGSRSIKYKKKLGIFSNSTGTITYDPLTKESRSYRHWPITTMIDGKLVFNSFGYSSTTSSHVWCIHSHLKQTLTKIDLHVNSSINLRDVNFLTNYIYKLKKHRASLRAERDSEYTRSVQIPRLIDRIEDVTKSIEEFMACFGTHPDVVNYKVDEEVIYAEALTEYNKSKKHTLDNAKIARKQKYYKLGLTGGGLVAFGLEGKHQWSVPVYVPKSLYKKVIKPNYKYKHYFGIVPVSSDLPKDGLEITEAMLPGYIKEKVNREVDSELS